MSPAFKTQLVTYPDSLGGDLKALSQLLAGPLGEVAAGGIHILPPYPSSADRGFSPIDQTAIDPAFGDWADIEGIAASRPVTFDLMVNHISRQSQEFQQYRQQGRRSVHADMFLTEAKIWRDRIPSAEDLASIVSQNPNGPIIRILSDRGEPALVWTTFGSTGSSEQVDLDLLAKPAREYIAGIMGQLASHGITQLRLNAVGYAIKKAGTPCFMVQPETDELLEWFALTGKDLGVSIVPDVHASGAVLDKLSENGHWIADHALPALILHAFLSKDATALVRHLGARPTRQFAVLDTHDGIPIYPDLDGVLSGADIEDVVQSCVQRGATVRRLAAVGGSRASSYVHQVYTTYFSALAQDEEAYLAARAIQLFSPGVPQLYYVGLLGGSNDTAAAASAGETRAINRHDFGRKEVEERIGSPLVRRLLDLVRLRNRHPAFAGAMKVLSPSSNELVIEWATTEASVSLAIDFKTRKWEVADAAPANEDTRMEPGVGRR